MMKKQVVNSILKSIPLVMVVVFAIAITFANEIVEHYPQKYWEHKKQYKIIINKRSTKLEELVKGTEIEKEYYAIVNNSKKELQEYTRIKNKIKYDTSVLGYETPKNMMFGIGFPTSGLVLSLIFLSLIINNIKNRHKKRFYLYISYSFILTFGYWVVWSLLWFKIDGKYDIPDYILYPSFLIISITFLIISNYFIKYLNNKESILKKKIRKLISFITFSRENVVKELAIEATNNLNNKKIERIVDVHENEMWKTLENTAK